MIVEVWVTLLLVFARVGAVLVSLPVFSAHGVPKYVAVLLAVLVTAVLAPGLPLAPVAGGIGTIALAAVTEIALGLLVGLGVSAVFSAFALAGEVLSQQMGFAMLTLFDPLLQAQDSPLGTLATLLAAWIFLGTGLHLEFLLVLGESVTTHPPGTLTVPLVEGGLGLADLVGTSILLGARLAGPIIALVFLINAFVGLLTRLAPRMNVFFSIGLSISSISGLVLFAAALPWLLVEHADAVRDTLAWAAHLLLGV